MMRFTTCVVLTLVVLFSVVDAHHLEAVYKELCGGDGRDHEWKNKGYYKLDAGKNEVDIEIILDVQRFKIQTIKYCLYEGHGCCNKDKLVRPCLNDVEQTGSPRFFKISDLDEGKYTLEMKATFDRDQLDKNVPPLIAKFEWLKPGPECEREAIALPPPEKPEPVPGNDTSGGPVEVEGGNGVEPGADGNGPGEGGTPGEVSNPSDGGAPGDSTGNSGLNPGGTTTEGAAMEGGTPGGSGANASGGFPVAGVLGALAGLAALTAGAMVAKKAMSASAAAKAESDMMRLSFNADGLSPEGDAGGFDGAGSPYSAQAYGAETPNTTGAPFGATEEGSFAGAPSPFGAQPFAAEMSNVPGNSLPPTSGAPQSSAMFGGSPGPSMASALPGSAFPSGSTPGGPGASDAFGGSPMPGSATAAPVAGTPLSGVPPGTYQNPSNPADADSFAGGPSPLPGAAAPASVAGGTGFGGGGAVALGTVHGLGTGGGGGVSAGAAEYGVAAGGGGGGGAGGAEVGMGAGGGVGGPQSSGLFGSYAPEPSASYSQSISFAESQKVNQMPVGLRAGDALRTGDTGRAAGVYDMFSGQQSVPALPARKSVFEK